MQIHHARSSQKTIAPDVHDDLLDSRMALLGLDLDAIESGDSATFDRIKQSCTACSFRQACTVDLKRDPNNPVWESYCPNSGALIALAETWWLT